MRGVRRWSRLRWALAAVCVAVGGCTAFLTVALGDCASWGTRCPATGLQGDVIGGVTFGLGAALAGPVLAWRPDRTGVALTVVAVVAIALPLGLIAARTLTR